MTIKRKAAIPSQAGRPGKQAEKIVRERYTGKLLPVDIIQFQGGDAATVSEILADPSKFHNKPCADPLEPEEGFGRAMLFVNTNGSVVVHSFLHGGANYFLRTASPPVKWRRLTRHELPEKPMRKFVPWWSIWKRPARQPASNRRRKGALK